MEKLLAQTAADATAGTAIAFTSIRPPSLTWDPGSGKTVLERGGAGWVDGASGLMAREDVARAILNTLDDDERYVGKCVAIGVEATEEEDTAAMSRLRAHYKSIR